MGWCGRQRKTASRAAACRMHGGAGGSRGQEVELGVGARAATRPARRARACPFPLWRKRISSHLRHATAHEPSSEWVARAAPVDRRGLYVPPAAGHEAVGELPAAVPGESPRAKAPHWRASHRIMPAALRRRHHHRSPVLARFDAARAAITTVRPPLLRAPKASPHHEPARLYRA